MSIENFKMNFFLVVLLYIIATVHPIEISDQYLNAANSRIRLILTGFYDKSQKLSIGKVEELHANATHVRNRFEKIRTHSCDRHQDSMFCEFADTLKNISKSCVDELEKFLDPDVRDKIKSEPFENYKNEVSLLMQLKLAALDIEINEENSGCYFAELLKNLRFFTEEADKVLGGYHDEVTNEFIEMMEAYREELLAYNRKISTTYKECIVRDDDRQCLETYIKANDNENLPFRFQVLTNQIIELIQEQLVSFGPDMVKVDGLFTQYCEIFTKIASTCEKKEKLP